MASPAPARAMALGSVALCMAQRSRPTLTSCQPPSPSSKVVAPAKPSDHCCGTMELPRLPQPKLGVPWAPLPQPHHDSGRGELGAHRLTTEFLIRAISARLGKVTGQLAANAAPIIAGELPGHAGAGTVLAWQRHRRWI